MSTQWPLVADAIATLAPTLPGWSGVTVFNGMPTGSGSPAVYFTVGYVPDNAGGGTYSIQQAPEGFRWTETGIVRSQLVCTAGGGDPLALRTQAFALADAFDAAARADRTLGVLSRDSRLVIDVEVQAARNETGVAAALVIAAHYQTTT